MQDITVWFELAEPNLKTSTIILAAEDPVISAALFHTFTCIEQSLKGYLLYNYRSFGKSWDLLRSLEACASLDKEFTSLKKEIAQVNPYNQSICYPTSSVRTPKPTKAKKLLEHATNVLTFVKKKAQKPADMKGRRVTY